MSNRPSLFPASIGARRRALSLLELVIAVAIMSAVVTAAVALMRSSRVVWQEQDGDIARLDAAHAVLRHIVRQLRQASAITAISNAADSSGTISATMADGATYVWSHNGSNVLYGQDTADQLLAEGIDSLSFEGYQADAATPTTTPADIRSVACTLKVTLDRDASQEKTIRSHVWLRSW